MIKKISSIIFSTIFYLYFALPSYAQTTIDPCPRDGGRWGSLCGLDKETIENFVVNGVTILFAIATIASIFFIIFGGIKWITSGGDKTNLESARNMIVAATIGLVITFLAYFIVNVVLELFGLDSISTFGIPSLVRPA